VRFPLVQPLAGAAPFITYTLAIIVVALVCGFLPGIMAVVLSVLTGWFLFLPPRFTFTLLQREAWMLITFTVVALINVTLISGLVAALLRHESRQRLLFRELP
jgi:two-component system sensor histidine kinase KdpD